MTASAKNDTPRTDAIVHNGTCVDAVNKYREISRQLERELTAALAEAEALREDAERWRMLFAFAEKYQLPMLQIISDVDAEIAARKGG